MQTQLDTRFTPHDTAGTPGGTSEGNRARLYVDGGETYRAALADIRNARRVVWLETYTLEPDEVGAEFIEALADAAARGCDVRLMCDRFGSMRFGRSHARPILVAGGHVAVYNPLLRGRRFGRRIASLLHRDHRKILVADDVAYTGGQNISTDYDGTDEAIFFDVMVRITGPSVRHMATVFVDAYRDATGESLPVPEPQEPFEDGFPVDVLELNREKAHHDLDVTLRRALRSAQASVWMVTPYFVPPQWVLDELRSTAQRGVDVQLLTAGRSDVPFARVAGRHLYGRLLSEGIRIFEMQHPILHAKFLVIDGRIGMIGSYNMDRYGALHNLEVGVAIHDERMAGELASVFRGCLERSEEVTMERWLGRGVTQRALQWAAHTVASLK